MRMYLVFTLLNNILKLNYSCRKHAPKLEHISDISFKRPIKVSSFIKMYAHVTYTQVNFMQIMVTAEVYDPETEIHSTTNMFYYTYSAKVDDLLDVIPKTYHEAMCYLDGRRHLCDALKLEEFAEKKPKL